MPHPLRAGALHNKLIQLMSRTTISMLILLSSVTWTCASDDIAMTQKKQFEQQFLYEQRMNDEILSAREQAKNQWEQSKKDFPGEAYNADGSLNRNHPSVQTAQQAYNQTIEGATASARRKFDRAVKELLHPESGVGALREEKLLRKQQAFQAVENSLLQATGGTVDKDSAMYKEAQKRLQNEYARIDAEIERIDKPRRDWIKNNFPAASDGSYEIIGGMAESVKSDVDGIIVNEDGFKEKIAGDSDWVEYSDRYVNHKKDVTFWKDPKAILNRGNSSKVQKLIIAKQTERMEKKLGRSLTADEKTSLESVVERDQRKKSTQYRDDLLDSVGSSSADAEIIHGSQQNSDKFPTTSGKRYAAGEKKFNKLNAFNSNQVKLVHSVGAKPVGSITYGNKDSVDFKTFAKSTYKGAQISGVSVDEGFSKQLKDLYDGKSVEEALDLLGDSPEVKDRKVKEFFAQSTQVNRKSYQVLETQNTNTGMQLEKDVETLKKNKVATERIHAAEKKLYQHKKLELENRAVIGELASINPELVGNVISDDGTVIRKSNGEFINTKTGRPLSDSEIKEHYLGKSANTVNDAWIFDTLKNSAAGKKLIESHRLITTSKAIRGLNMGIGFIDVGISAVKGAERAVAEEQSGDSFGKTYIKSLYYSTPVSGLQDTLKSSTFTLLDNYQKEIEATDQPTDATRIYALGKATSIQLAKASWQLAEGAVTGICDTGESLGSFAEWATRGAGEEKILQQSDSMEKRLISYRANLLQDFYTQYEALQPDDTMQRQKLSNALGRVIETWKNKKNTEQLLDRAQQLAGLVKQQSPAKAEVVVSDTSSYPASPATKKLMLEPQKKTQDRLTRQKQPGAQAQQPALKQNEQRQRPTVQQSPQTQAARTDAPQKWCVRTTKLVERVPKVVSTKVVTSNNPRSLVSINRTTSSICGQGDIAVDSYTWVRPAGADDSCPDEHPHPAERGAFGANAMCLTEYAAENYLFFDDGLSSNADESGEKEKEEKEESDAKKEEPDNDLAEVRQLNACRKYKADLDAAKRNYLQYEDRYLQLVNGFRQKATSHPKFQRLGNRLRAIQAQAATVKTKAEWQALKSEHEQLKAQLSAFAGQMQTIINALSSARTTECQHSLQKVMGQRDLFDSVSGAGSWSKLTQSCISMVDEKRKADSAVSLAKENQCERFGAKLLSN